MKITKKYIVLPHSLLVSLTLEHQQRQEKNNRGLGVLMPYHKTLRKVLFELGHITNPNEYTKIRENISQIAVQIALGLEVNVARYYKKEAYEFNNAFYDTKQAAIKERMRKTDFRGDVINNPIKTVLIGLDSVEGDIYFYANP